MAALGDTIVRPPFLAYLDFLNDPLRATTWETSIQMADTGDPDIDGHLFSAVDPSFASISAVKRQTGGSDTVTATLSGIVGPNSDLLDLLGDEMKWKGRDARLWFMVFDEEHNRIGAVVPYYTGRMVDFSIAGKSISQKVSITIETYLAVLSAASNRSYLDQHMYDPNDSSAALTTTVANGARTAAANSNVLTITADTY
jgi:hypothetical protein